MRRTALPALLCCLALAASGCMQTSLKVVAEFGSSGQGPGELKEPADLACDSKGNVYVCDAGNGRVLRFDENGDSPTVFAGGMKRPVGICVDRADNVYVADQAANRVYKFGPTGARPVKSITGTLRPGQPLEKETALNGPRDVAVDEGLNIYIVDNLHRLLLYDSSGSFLREYRQEGSQPSQFKFPVSLAITPWINENKAFLMYIADAHNTRVQKLDSEFKVIYALREKGLLDHMRDPRGVTTKENGDFFVADCGSTPVAGYTSAGAYSWKAGSFGRGRGKLLRPGGIAYCAYNKRLYVSDTLQDKIVVFATK